MLQATAPLKKVRREWHSRKNVAYITYDKQGIYLILSQRLPLLSAFLSTIAEDEASKVSTTTLYQMTNVENGRMLGWCKHRWRVAKLDLGEAAEVFESARSSFQRPVLLGSPCCYV